METSKKVREILMTFPQVQYAVSQTGRPDDGTDVAGFYNNEFDVLMYPEDDWRPKISKDELINRMNVKLSKLTGVNLNFSQLISDNVEEAVSGDSLNYTEGKIQDVYKILRGVKGIEDLGIMKSIGLPELDIILDQQKMAQYGGNYFQPLFLTVLGPKAPGR
ncbi:cobalt-zinc-cadmium resistance protein CzcA [Mucilaginibacter lappiensis]|uniref:Cobalt-zinc-cadmium resistance protein CzcA n=1 Tax=Mucilaginibacter lappiensis TaxID=354630 RepID=A0A841J625_9SPHI|nr:efflux RND transporter permease subunit [Mucilaginibacter lappiensis]MBB6126483.1 cobalt-zinc-cadmium resistance protein CzcA [Mucilaginibacter lappiensis]